MVDLIAVGPTADLRRFGSWSESAYTYGHSDHGPVAVKRFTWEAVVKPVHGGLDLPLNYGADAVCDSRRKEDLAYVAAVERAALESLEAMVRCAVQGVAYVGMPDPIACVALKMIELGRTWITREGPPEGWEQQIYLTVRDEMNRLTGLRVKVEELQARVDSDHPNWGLAVPIHPLEPKAA